MANDYPSPTDVRIEGSKLVWEPVVDAGGYNIYFEYSYLTTVKDRTDFDLQIPGRYQVVAFDQSASLFSIQFGDNTLVTYEGGDTQSETVGFSFMTVVSATCQNVDPGGTCVASCSSTAATGGACATSDIVEADAFASTSSYSCTVPTFSGEVTAQVYCLNRQALR
ncbi:MAG: hypothetical protein ACI82O_004281 [Patiriisocius sp.]|jgi:hypothetical protein